MGKILGIDYGDSRIGFAISDSNKTIAFPFDTVSNQGFYNIKQVVNDIIKRKDIECIVLGLPVSLSGSETEQTKKVRGFYAVLKDLKIPIEFQDERLSTISAKKSLIKQKIKTGYNKHLVDSTAAAIFLQQYLDYKKNL